MKPKSRNRIQLALFLISGALTFSSCGSDGGVGTTPTPTPSPTPLTSDFTPPTGASAAPSNAGPYGPWNTRLMSATSNDGLTFQRTSKVVTDQGDVPDLVQDSNGSIYLYYTGWMVGAEQNKTVVAISSDGGSDWVYKKLSLSGFEGMASPVDPDVQILSDGTFRLYLTSSRGGESPRTYYAEGTDGINFTKKGVAFSQEGRNVLDPSTLLISSTWHLFAGGATPGVNWHATSSDGKSFTLVAQETFTLDWNNDGTPDKYLMANGLRASEDAYRFYTFESFQIDKSFRSFMTTDGSSWTADAGARLTLDTSSGKESDVIKDPAVLKLSDGTYFMVYVTKIP